LGNNDLKKHKAVVDFASQKIVFRKYGAESSMKLSQT